jgi:23S rRNA (uracil1939-C5)-methyltransferase
MAQMTNADSAQLIEITLAGLTYSGDAIGKLSDGRAVFVPFGLPGERVRIRLIAEKRNFARAELVEVLEASPERISARCRHFGECGGCQYQHMPYEFQLKAKADILRDQLQRIGKIDKPNVLPAVACPSPWNYRNHVQFHLTKEDQLGYVRSSSRQSSQTHSSNILPISECHLPQRAINELWPQLEFESEPAIDRVSIRAGSSDELMLVLESASPDVAELEIEAGISVAHIFEDSTVVLAGNDHIVIKILDREFHVSAASFFQVNTPMAEKMVTYLLDRLPTSPATVLLDVYCGVGLFSAYFAPKCKQVMGVELSPSACEDFEINLNEFDNVTLYEGAAEDIIPHLDVKADIVIVDPPRAGLERATLDAIVRSRPQTIAYVSCDPSTLARDAARLRDGQYRLVESTPFDLFPQTYHIESISLFER